MRTELGLHHTWPAKRTHWLPCLLLQASLRGLNPISTSNNDVDFIVNLFLYGLQPRAGFEPELSADLFVANKLICTVFPLHCVTVPVSLWGDRAPLGSSLAAAVAGGTTTITTPGGSGPPQPPSPPPSASPETARYAIGLRPRGGRGQDLAAHTIGCEWRGRARLIEGRSRTPLAT